VKPWYVGTFHHGGHQMDSPSLMRSFGGGKPRRRTSMSYSAYFERRRRGSPDLQPGVVFALYTKAMAIAASAPGDKDRMGNLAPRVHALFTQSLGASTNSGDFAYRVEQAWDATRQARNSGVHLNKFRHTHFDFEAGGATLEYLAFRTVYALVFARLVRDGHLDASDRSSALLTADVAATESWLDMLSRPPDDLRPSQKWTKARQGARNAYLKAKFIASGVNP
jgi:hypothetical protein